MSLKLTKDSGALRLTKNNINMTSIKMGLGWDAKKKNAGGLFGKLFGGNSDSSEAIDLDASVLLFDKSKQHVETIYFGRLTSADGCVRHSGDNRTGEGSGDDETISINLEKLPASVQSMVFLINSFTGQLFSQVANAYCRVIDPKDNSEHCKYDLSEGSAVTGYLMAKVSRCPEGWEVTALGVPCTGRTARDLESISSKYA